MANGTESLKLKHFQKSIVYPYIYIYVYDAMISPVLNLAAENPVANHSVYLLLTNNNRFETLILKDNSSTLTYSKIKKRITIRKKKLKSKSQKI